MGGLTLDAGPLIAADRGDDAVRASFARALELDADLIVSAATVAEAWRGGPRSARLARLLASCEIDAVDEPLAKRAGELLGAANSSHTLDAIVVATAEARRARVLTSDLDDLQPLADVAGVDVRGF